MLNKQKNELQVRSVTGHLNAEEVNNAKQKVGEGATGWVAKTHQPLILGPNTDINQYQGLKLRSTNATAAMAVPTLLRGDSLVFCTSAAGHPMSLTAKRISEHSSV